jgi:hypothetical protein
MPISVLLNQLHQALALKSTFDGEYEQYGIGGSAFGGGSGIVAVAQGVEG